MRRWAFNVVTVVSLLMCVGVGALWGRSLGHFERVDLRYARRAGADELQSVFVGFSWYSNTLRLEVIRLPFGPGYFRGRSEQWLTWFRNEHPAGVRLAFLGEAVTREMNGYRPGFAAGHYPYSTAGVVGDRWVLAVRPWALMLVTGVLPAVWVYRFWKRRGARRRGLCPACGYDLRATPGRCPECGSMTQDHVRTA